MSGTRHGGRKRGDAGMAVVELAFAVPALLAVAALGLWSLGVGRTAIVLADEARDAARAIARGEAPAPLSEGTRADRTDAGGLVTVSLAREVAVPVLGGLSLTVTQSASAAIEEAGAR